MLFKVAGSVLTVLASTLIGLVYSRDLSRRPSELRDLQGMLEMLQTQIIYLSSILTDAFEKIYKNSNSSVSVFFREAAIAMKKDNSISAEEAWHKSVKENIKNTSLNRDDLNVLLSFGKCLGNTDMEGQINNIRFTIEQLKIQENKAEENRKKNEVLYRNLGFLGGLALVIIFI